MANYFRALGYCAPPSSRALGCVCRSRPLAGYIAATLRGYRAVTLSGLGDPVAAGTPALLPISDRKAVAAAIRAFQQGRRPGLADAAQAQGAASMAAAGAKAGSIVPGIGTVIGAVVGAVAGWVMGKAKPVRPSGAQVAECRQLLSEYSSMAAQVPYVPMPLELAQLQQLNWCLMAVYGADIKLKDPRFFDGSYLDLLAIARQVVKAIYETPVGGTVQVSETVNKVRGQTFKSSGISFTNPQYTRLSDFAQQQFLKVAIQYCDQTAGKGKGGCSALYNRPEFHRWLLDLLGYAARTELPNISDADLREASKVAADTGTSASAVVQAVEQIIGRSVQRDQTAELLSPGSSTAPPPSTALPTPSGAPPPQAQPPPMQPLPAPILQQPQIHVVQVPSAQPKAEPTLPVQAGLGGNNALLLGALAAGGLFLFARPAPRSRSSGARRRSR